MRDGGAAGQRGMVANSAGLDALPNLGSLDGRPTGTFGGKQYPSAVRVVSEGWRKAIQVMWAHWQARKFDPVKGPPKLPKDVSALGMAVQEESRVVWCYKMPAGLATAIGRRQPVEPEQSAEQATTRERPAIAERT